jgi:hypothetical protein
MREHPEQLEGETFLGNAEPASLRTKRLCAKFKTLRLGKTAYCIYGTTKNMQHLRPMLIGKEEEKNYNKMYETECENIRRGIAYHYRKE